MAGLEYLIPQRTSFKLDETEYFFRPFNLEDEAWLRDKFGENLEEALNGSNWRDTCVIAYHQLEFEGKKAFSSLEKEDFNDDGDLVKIKVTGPERLLSSFKTVDQIYGMFNALMKCRGLSLPELDDVVKQAEELEVKKKELMDKQTGN